MAKKNEKLREIKQEVQNTLAEILTKNDNKSVLCEYTELTMMGYPCGIHYDSKTKKLKIVDLTSNG